MRPAREQRRQRQVNDSAAAWSTMLLGNHCKGRVSSMLTRACQSPMSTKEKEQGPTHSHNCTLRDTASQISAAKDCQQCTKTMSNRTTEHHTNRVLRGCQSDS